MHSCNQHFQTKQKLYRSWEISMKFLFLLNHFPKISLLSLPHNILYQSSIHLSLIFSYSIVIWSLITICEKGLAGYMLLLSCLKICLTEFNRFYQCHKFMNRVRECLVTNSIAFLRHHHHFLCHFAQGLNMTFSIFPIICVTSLVPQQVYMLQGPMSLESLSSHFCLKSQS